MMTLADKLAEHQIDSRCGARRALRLILETRMPLCPSLRAAIDAFLDGQTVRDLRTMTEMEAEYAAEFGEIADQLPAGVTADEYAHRLAHCASSVALLIQRASDGDPCTETAVGAVDVASRWRNPFDEMYGAA